MAVRRTEATRAIAKGIRADFIFANRPGGKSKHVRLRPTWYELQNTRPAGSAENRKEESTTKLIQQGHEIITPISPGGEEELRAIENAARTSFASESAADMEATKNFIAGLIAKGHEGPLEHVSLSVLFTTNRAIANELTRHRHMSFVQESTRYCNYSKNRFDGHVSFVFSPYFPVGSKAFEEFTNACQTAERAYFDMLESGCPPEQARDVLPLATKTRVLANGNLREWRHILKLRFANQTGKAHPMMRELMGALLDDLTRQIPVVFDDI